MKTLTPETAEKLARNIFSNLKNKEDREFYVVHSPSVVDIALILAEKKKVDKNILKIAGWLHDTGACISREDHAVHSIAIIEKEYEISAKIKDCILNHGTSGQPKTEEGKIIKIADKASFLNPELIRLAVHNMKDGKIKQDDINFLKKASSQAFELLENFK